MCFNYPQGYVGTALLGIGYASHDAVSTDGGMGKSRLELGLPVNTAVEEEKAGMGSKSTRSDDRPFLVDDEILVARVLARVAGKRAYTGLERPITGMPFFLLERVETQWCSRKYSRAAT